MENLIISLRAVLPLFICMVLGFCLKQFHFMDRDGFNKVNKMCFKIFLPIYLFRSVYKSDLSAAFDLKLLGMAIAGLMVIFLLMMLLMPKAVKDRKKCSVMIMATYRSNFVLLGLPIATYLCGEENLGATSMLIAIMVPLFNVLSVICLEYFRGGKADAKKILKGIATNPLIIGTLLGIALYFTHWELPYVLDKVTLDLSRVASPLALIALGGSFNLSGLKNNRWHIAAITGAKLIVVPAVMVTIAILLGYRNDCLVPILIGFGAPVAVNSFTMAQQMGADEELAADLVVFTSACSILTLFLWVFLLKTLGMI